MRKQAAHIESGVSGAFRWAVRHWLGFLVLGSGTLVSLAFAAPILAMTGHETSSSWIYSAFRVTCHQLPHHSWFLGGSAYTHDWAGVAAVAGVDPAGADIQLMHRPIRDGVLGYQMAFCQRDTAIHLAFFLTVLGFAVFRPRSRPLPWRWYALAILPMAVDGLTQLAGMRQSNPALRSVTGALFGAATGLLVLPHLDAGFREILSTPPLPAGWAADVPYRLVLGTHNAAKRAELSSLLTRLAMEAGVALELVAPEDVGFRGDVPEAEPTFEMNSASKARSYHDATQLPVITDDGGLEIGALDGAPGVMSRRWLGRDIDSTDEDLIAYTLEKLDGLDVAARGARLRTCLTFYDGHALHQECAAIDGHIAATPSPRRTPGYPYRALFVVNSLGKYYDDLSSSEHQEVNHRARAVRHLFWAAILPAVRSHAGAA